MNLSFLKRNISPEVSRILRNTTWLFSDRVLRMGVGFVIGVWMARYLGVQQYGLFNYATAFVYLFTPLITLGLDSVVVRDLVKDASVKNQVLGTTFGLRLVGAVVCTILAIASITLLRPDQPLTIALVAILAGAASFQAFETIDLWFQSQVQSRYTVIAKCSAFFGIAALKVSLILLQAPLVWFAWAVLGEMLLGAIALILIYQRQGHAIQKWRWSSAMVPSLVREGFPLMLSGLTIMLYMKIDQVMLGQMVDDRAVGIYTAATRISEAWYFIPTVIVSSVTPSIYQARERSETDYYRRVGRLLHLLNRIAIAVAIPVTLLSPAIIQLCYGPGYAQSSAVLTVHIWASIFVFMGVATLPCFVVDGLTTLTLRRTLLGAIVNVILNLLLIPHYTVIGAAIATVISQAIASYVSHAFHPRTLKLFLIQTRSLLPL